MDVVGGKKDQNARWRNHDKRNFDCADYDRCLTTAAIKNSRMDCGSCPQYVKSDVWRLDICPEQFQRCEALLFAVSNPEINRMQGVTWGLVLDALNRDDSAHVFHAGKAVVGRANKFFSQTGISKKRKQR